MHLRDLRFALAWLLPGHFYPYTAFQQDMLSMAGVVLLALAGLGCVALLGWV